MKHISEEQFNATKTLANLKHHDFSVQDYKMCKLESDLVQRALEKYITDLAFENLQIESI